MNVTKGTGAKGNRKQQQQQQQKSSQSNASQSSGRKNSKTNGKNQSGKNWKQRLTSPRPLTTLSNRDRNKFEPMNGIPFANRTTTTTVRPIKLSNNNVDNKGNEKAVYIKSPVKASKQVKEIITASSNINTRIDIGNESVATIKNTENVPVTKSTVSKVTTASPLDAHVELVGNLQHTSNPNIPKLFQRYEKIQEFYPEFHPYVGLPKASSSLSGSTSGGAMSGKPSRDGSKHSHFISTSNQQDPPSASVESINFAKSALEKPSTSRTEGTAVISSTNGKG